MPAEPALLPWPDRVTLTGGTTAVTTAPVRADPDVAAAAAVLRTFLSVAEPAGSHSATVELRVDTGAIRQPEGYRLTVDELGVQILAGGPAGAFYGAQTLRQLVSPSAFATLGPAEREAPRCVIEDTPRFGWRGAMLDVARHFFAKNVVLKFIDQLAAHKLNVLHLHLTDDQGWRLEVPKYPRLTTVGAWRSQTLVGHAGRPRQEWTFDGVRHGGFYTTDDLNEIVAYAAGRFVTVVPEVDMPGHMQAAIAAYPQLGNLAEPLSVDTGWGISPHILNVDDATLDFCRDVLAQLVEVFPGPYVHCGGDEVPKQEWVASTRVQQRIRELKLADEEALQGWFTGQLAAFLARAGRRLVGWDEILAGGPLPASAVVMSWRGEDGGIAAARAGHDVVMAPNTATYLDYRQSESEAEPLAIGGLLPLERVYGYEPVPAGIDEAAARHVLGTQAQLWTEYMPDVETLEYMAFPRLIAFAERAWGRHPDDYPAFLARLRAHLPRLTATGVAYRPLDG